MELVDVTVFYLEMLERPAGAVDAPSDGLMVVPVERPSVPYYRFLYNAVGQDYHWLSRRKMSDEQLATVLDAPTTELHVLHVEGSPAGFAELDCQPNGIELVQFGLLPEYIGRKLGPWFLSRIIEHVWNSPTRRFWLHTCSLDHPAAVRTYQQAGFRQYRVEQIQREL